MLRLHASRIFVVFSSTYFFMVIAYFTDMRKQRKMGHITFVGPCMGIVEARLKSMLTEMKDDQPAGGLCSFAI